MTLLHIQSFESIKPILNILSSITGPSSTGRGREMFKFLKGVVGGSGAGIKDLPYNIGEPYLSAWGSWVHCRGTSRDDGAPVSIFSLSGSNANDGHLAAGRNGVKRLRTVRHPNILSFLYSTEAETFDGSTTKVTIYVVTEPVMPLSDKLKELGLEGSQRDEYYAWGLHRICKAVSFLNNDCKLVHGNVSMASVVVTPTLDWKLHAFDVLSEFDGNNSASTRPMLQYEWLIAPQYKPMELVKSDWAAIRNSPPCSIDSWGLGCFIYELFSGLKLVKTEELRNTSSIPKSLLPDYQRLLSSMPSRRLNSSKLLENSEYFQNKLVETIHFMEILNLKDSVEKDAFFRKLPNLAEQLPQEIVLKKLLPLLASALEFGSAAAPALTALLKMGSWLSQEDFGAKVLPTVVKLFASNDRAIRVGLLQHIDQYGESLSAQIVDEQVYPHVATGFSDTSAFLRELTLKSMLVLSPKLSQRTISGSLLKHLSKLQVDEEPAIRTNTTILLGNIASNLNEGMRKRVLINAFTVRALRDTFSPARGAGIMALCATISYYDTVEIATRILPNVVVLTIDPDGDVCSKAFQAVDQFMQIMKQHHEKTSSGDTSETESAGNSLGSGNAGLLGWAMSSLTLKGKSVDQSQGISSNSSQPINAASSNTPPVIDSSTIPPVRVSSSNSLTDLGALEPVVSVDDVWGEVQNGIHEDQDDDKDGWDDIEPLEDSKPSPALANIQAAQKRPVFQPKPQGTGMKSKATSATINGEDDDLWGSTPAPPETAIKSSSNSRTGGAVVEDDDPWGAIAAPAPRSSVKPLHRKSSSTTAVASIVAAAADNDDPWASIAAPAPTTRVKPLSLGRGGRGIKPAAPKLGAQKINRTSSGVEGSIHEYKNETFIPHHNSFFLHGGSEGLYATKVALNDPYKDPSSDLNNPLDGKSFIRFDLITFKRTKESANKQNEMQPSTGLVETIVVEVKDRDKIGGAYLNTDAICCTPTLAKDGYCKVGEVIIREDLENPGWPKRIQTSFEGNNEETSMTLQTVEIKKTGMYYLYFMHCNPELVGTVMNGKTVWHNPDGFLPGKMAPLMTFYGLMSLAYLVLGLCWFLRFVQHWKDIIQLHFHITAVIGLGMCEMALWYYEYSNLNATGYRPLAITIWAVTFSVIKKTISRLLLLVVSMGFGVMVPTLGGISLKILVLGVIYFVASEALELVEHLGNINDFSGKARLFLVLPVAVLDACFILWIFSSLSKTLEKLQIRKSLAKLELYRKFTNALAMSVLLSVAWIGYELYFNASDPLSELWRFSWIISAFWTLLAYSLLVLICFLWSPSNNPPGFSYSEETVVDEEEGIPLTSSGVKVAGGDAATKLDRKERKASVTPDHMFGSVDDLEEDKRE